MIATTIVELGGWGPRVQEVLDRVEQMAFVGFVAILFVLFTVAWAAVAVSLRR